MLLTQISLLLLLAADSFVGTWKINPTKTKLAPGSPEIRKSETMTIDDMGPSQYRVTRITPDGNNSTVGLTFDGKEHSDSTTTALGVKVAPRHYKNTIRGPKGTLVSEWLVSPDGKTLTNLRKGNGTSSGRPIDEALVYDRQKDN